MPSDNQKFLAAVSKAIRSDPNHLLRFLLNARGTRVMTLEGGNGNYYDQHAGPDGAIYEGSINGGKPTSGLSSSDIADSLGVSLSVDACHVTTKNHGAEERFCLGIAEDNRGHGYAERRVELKHEAVVIGGWPVDRASALKWEASGLLPPGTVSGAVESSGWSRTAAPAASSWSSPPPPLAPSERPMDGGSVSTSGSVSHDSSHVKQAIQSYGVFPGAMVNDG
jgi:hypothetical protein